MCVNVRCSHKRGALAVGGVVRWQGVAWSVENKRKPLSQGNGHSCFIHSFIHSLVVSFAPFSAACMCVCVGFRFGSGPTARLWTPSLTVDSPRARRAATQHARNIHFKA